MVKKTVNIVVNYLVKIVEVLMVLMLVIMMCTLFWQVFTRFVIKIPSIWTEEIARYSFIYMTMLGAALGVRYSKHFGMTLVIDKFQGQFKAAYERYVINGIIFICSLFLLYYGWKFTFTLGMVRVSPTFLVPMAWIFISIPVSSFLMAVFSMYNMAFGNYTETDEVLEKEILLEK